MLLFLILGLLTLILLKVILFLVEEHLSRHILEEIGRAGEFEEKPGTGIAFQLDVEDAVGISHQAKKITDEMEQLL